MSDPLAHLRKKAQTTDPQNPEPGIYKAFGTKDKVMRLKIRRANGLARAPTYSYLLDIAHDGAFGTMCVLLYTFVWVKIKGKNLQGLFLALESDTVDFVQEYSKSVWPDPPASNEPMIEQIEVVPSKDQTEWLTEMERPKIEELHA